MIHLWAKLKSFSDYDHIKSSSFGISNAGSQTSKFFDYPGPGNGIYCKLLPLNTQYEPWFSLLKSIDEFNKLWLTRRLYLLIRTVHGNCKIKLVTKVTKINKTILLCIDFTIHLHNILINANHPSPTLPSSISCPCLNFPYLKFADLKLSYLLSSLSLTLSFSLFNYLSLSLCLSLF